MVANILALIVLSCPYTKRKFFIKMNCSRLGSGICLCQAYYNIMVLMPESKNKHRGDCTFDSTITNTNKCLRPIIILSQVTTKSELICHIYYDEELGGLGGLEKYRHLFWVKLSPGLKTEFTLSSYSMSTTSHPISFSGGSCNFCNKI